MDAAAELGRNSVSKHQVQPEYGDEQADAGREAEPVSRQPAHLHTAYLRDSSRVPRRRPFMKPPYAIGSVPSLSGHAIAYR